MQDRLHIHIIIFFFCATATFCFADDTQPIRAEVDATSLSRHLLHSRLTYSVSPGDFALWFPKWIPGIHGPGAQIGNLAGLRVTTAGGEPVEWHRDPDELCRFLIDVPEKIDTIEVRLTYIANQPTANSTGVDSYGNSDLLAINFNTCLLYPDDSSASDTLVELSVKLPHDWKYGTALRTASEADETGTIKLETASVETVIDSPLIAGKHYRLLEIETPDFPETRMHFVSESAKALKFVQEQADHYSNLMAEAALLFGGAPYESYDFLVVCSDKVPPLGLEHSASSLNVIGERDLIDDDLRKGWSAYLLPHELVHAWCGKYRRPAGMVRSAYHRNKQTELLWIYEGLTQYLGGVLTARSGLLSFDEHLESTASRIGYLSLRQGRSWRSLADTAIANYTLRASSQSWNDLRRGQDYYDEGALFWLEVDCIIRKATGGKKSLDDFCQKFFAHHASDPKVKSYELEDVVAGLNELADYDWQGLIRRRVYRPMDELGLEGLWQSGYRFTMTDEKPEYFRRREEDREYFSAEYSLGITLDKDSKIYSVAPEVASDRAGVSPTMELVGVGGLKFTKKRLTAAIADSTETGNVELLVLEGDRYRTIKIDYDGGVRFPAIERKDGEEDLLREICKPLSL